LKQDKINYKIIGHSYEDFTGVYTREKPANNKWFIKLLLLTPIGSFYYSEVIHLDETDKISAIKSQLVTLKIIDNAISYREGQVFIE
jgi:hypothetical protein